MKELLFAGICIFLFFLYLLGEKIYLKSQLHKIPLRICVTGTRGKSTVTRLIAGILREDGRKVLARTTGSRPMIIFPDGHEIEISRQGPPSILEGKALIKRAIRLKAQALVVEMMSIQPETLLVEAARIFQPQILAITNVRLDHQEFMGTTKKDIASSFGCAITKQCSVFIPEKECFPVLERKAAVMNARLFKVSGENGDKYLEDEHFESPFKNDIGLVLSVAESLGINRKTAVSGMRKSQSDIGSFKVWRTKTGFLPKASCFISAFAANEPESTEAVLGYLNQKTVFQDKKSIALISLRQDRGERTLQWLKALEAGFLSEFDKIFLLGEPARAVFKKLKSSSGLKNVLHCAAASPAEIMAETVTEDEESVVVGMGNMTGRGQSLVQYWDTIGERYAL